MHRRMHWEQLLLVFALAQVIVIGCRSNPATPDGIGLRCGETADCSQLGDTTRCVAGICVANSPPEVDELQTLRVVVGESVTIEPPPFRDPDGDEITTQWQQVAGPPLLATPQSGGSLSITPGDIGSHVFEFVVTDPSGASTSTRLLVLAEPIAGALYVSDNFLDAPDCGDLLSPCGSLEGAFRSELFSPASIVLVAANAAGSSYATCLNQADGVIVGGFAPDTWVPSQTLVERTVITCDDPNGHTLSGTAEVRSATLATAPAVAPQAGTPLTTLRVPSGAPTLERAQVNVAACGDPSCSSTGVLVAAGSTARLRDTRVVGILDSSASSRDVYGVVSLGGTVELSGGETLMGVLAANSATGLLAVKSTVTIQGTSFAGGALTPTAVAVDLISSSLTMSDTTITQGGILTEFAVGLRENWCGPTEDCGCASWGEDCTAVIVAQEDIDIDIANTAVTLPQSSDALRSQTCVGYGMVFSGFWNSIRVADSSVFVGPNYGTSYGIGLLHELAMAPTFSGTPVAYLERNAIFIEESTYRPECSSVESAAGLGGPGPGGFGLIASRTPDGVFADNTVTVRAHTRTSAGFHHVLSGGTHVLRNTFRVGDGTAAVSHDAVGALLGRQPSAQVGSFRQNRVFVGDYVVTTSPGGTQTAGTGLGTGLRISDTNGGSARNASWNVENNFIAVGDALHSVGLNLNIAEEGNWPRVVHNTFALGSNPIGGSNRALTMRGVNGDSSLGVGQIFNNYFTMGDSPGRRAVVSGAELADRPDPPVTVLGGNVVGWDPVGTKVGPWIGVGYRSDEPLIFARDAAERIPMVLNGSLTETADYRGLDLTPEMPRFGWVGGTGTSAIVVLGMSASIRVETGSGVSPTIDDVIPRTGTGELIVPTRAVIGNGDGTGDPDLVFVAPSAGACPSGSASQLWMMRRSGPGYALPEVLSAIQRCDVLAMGASPSGQLAVIASDGITVDVGFGFDLVNPLAPELVGEPIVAVEPMSLTALGARDLLVVSDELFMYRGLSLFDTFSNPVPVTDPPCGSAQVSSYRVTGWEGGSSPYLIGKIVVGCSDGSIEVFGYESSSETLVRMASAPAPAPGSAPASFLMEMGNAPGDGRLLAIWQDDERVAVVDFTDATVPAGTGTLIEVAAHTFIGSVGSYQGFSPQPGVADVYVSGQLLEASCDLVDAGAGDLHLAGTATSCIDSGDSSVTSTQDFDGCGARTDGMPDVGADELDAQGTSCPLP